VISHIKVSYDCLKLSSDWKGCKAQKYFRHNWQHKLERPIL